MQLFVKSLSGQTLTVDAGADQTVADVKSALQVKQGIPSDQARLLFAGHDLDDEASLTSYGIGELSTLHLSLRLLGGGKKKKKKNYTTPKKTKRKHKKVKLAVLTYYKVDENGKITRIRRECENCGAGVFMANHFDRQYCGKCGLTYTFNAAK